MGRMSLKFPKARSRSIRVLPLCAIAWSASLALAANDDARTKDDSETGTGWFIPSGTPAKNYYFGVRVATDRSNYPDSNQDGSVTGVRSKETGTGTGLVVGYQFNDYLAVEGGHRDFGESDFSGTSSGGPSWTAGPVRATNEASAWNLGVWGRWPIAPRWHALGYLGWSWWNSKETFVEGSFVSVEENSGGDAVYALGFEWDVGLQNRIVYRFMGSRHSVDDSGYDITSGSAEMVYRFP